MFFCFRDICVLMHRDKSDLVVGCQSRTDLESIYKLVVIQQAVYKAFIQSSLGHISCKFVGDAVQFFDRYSAVGRDIVHHVRPNLTDIGLYLYPVFITQFVEDIGFDSSLEFSVAYDLHLDSQFLKSFFIEKDFSAQSLEIDCR